MNLQKLMDALIERLRSSTVQSLERIEDRVERKNLNDIMSLAKLIHEYKRLDLDNLPAFPRTILRKSIATNSASSGVSESKVIQQVSDRLGDMGWTYDEVVKIKRTLFQITRED
jgi:hypothetical protein